MPDLAVACIAALGSATLYAASVTLQALEARQAPVALQLRPSLIVFLLRRPRWLLGTGFGLLGWPLQAVALAFGPLALVQPILALSLVGLLFAGHRVLGEPVNRSSLVAVAGIVGGIILLAREVPTGGGGEHELLLAITLVLLGAISLLPYARRGGRADSAVALAFAAGASYVVLALTTTLLDGAIGRSAWWPAIALAGRVRGGRRRRRSHGDELTPEGTGHRRRADHLLRGDDRTCAARAGRRATARHGLGICRHRSRRPRPRRYRRHHARTVAPGGGPRSLQCLRGPDR